MNGMCDELAQHLFEMQKVALQTVAHKKKFQLFINQFARFLEMLREISTDDPLTTAQKESYCAMLSLIRECHQIFSQNFLYCWAHTAVDNPCSQVATDLFAITTRLHEISQVFDEESSNCFDTADPQWLQFHILDLKAISASFNQYLSMPTLNPQVANVMNGKLHSINQFLDQYENEDLIPGVQVFSPIPINYQIWRIHHNDFSIEGEEGSGGLAVVYYGHYKPTGEEVAIKQLKFTKLSGSHLRIFQREVTILATARHPSLLHFVGATDTTPFCILTEWMPGGSLFQELNKYHRLTQTQLTMCAIDIARGMAFLHSMQIIHRDLKSLNVLLDRDGKIKICDFGFSRFKTNDDDTMTQNIGTPHWMAPELLGGSTTYNEKIDVYAYGIVLWEILVKQLPYSGLDQAVITAQVLLNDIRPPIPPNTPGALSELIQLCWQRDFNKRPSFSEILKMWRSGAIFYPGADKEDVLRYLQSTLDEKDRACTNVENFLIDSDSSINASKETVKKDAIIEFYYKLLPDGIPVDLVDRCWENLISLPHDNDELNEYYVKSLALFLKTTAASKAICELREMRPGSVPKNIVIEALAMIPTGDTNLDDNIVILACKNDCHGEALIHAMQPRHIKIALEVICRKQLVTPKLKDLVIERCLRYIGVYSTRNKSFNKSFNTFNNENLVDTQKIDHSNNSIDASPMCKDNVLIDNELFNRSFDNCNGLGLSDDFVAISAIRCLTSMNAYNLIPLDFIENGALSRNVTLKKCCYVLAAKLASDGVKLSNDLIEICMLQWNFSDLAGTVVVNACKNVENAEFVLNCLNKANMISNSLIIRTLVQIAKHSTLRGKMKEVLKNLIFFSNDADINAAWEKINAILSDDAD